MIRIVGAVCDRAFFLELTKYGRSQTAPTVGNPSLRLLPRPARNLIAPAGGSFACTVVNVLNSYSQFIAKDLTRGALGQFGNEFNPSRIFIGSNAALHELLEFADQLGTCCRALFQDYECFGRKESGIFFESNNRRFQYGIVL